MMIQVFKKSAHLAQKNSYMKKTTNKQSQKLSKVKFWPKLSVWNSAYIKSLDFKLQRNWFAW